MICCCLTDRDWEEEGRVRVGDEAGGGGEGAHLVEGGGGVGHVQVCGTVEQVGGFGIVAFEGGEDASGIHGFGSGAGAGEAFGGTRQVA